MITFKSRCESIRQADMIMRTAKSIYPHVSTSRTQVSISKILPTISNNEPLQHKLCSLKLRKENEIDDIRNEVLCGIDYYRDIVNRLKAKKVGNCHEEALFSQIIGKINGIKNIYTANVFFNRNSSGAESRLRHVVAVITDKFLEKDYRHHFKNKEAIIIDPWLGVTEFAGGYYNKLRNDFGHIFQPVISNVSSITKRDAKTMNLEQYQKLRKQKFKSDFSFEHIKKNLESDSCVFQLRKEFPELSFKNQPFKK